MVHPFGAVAGVFEDRLSHVAESRRAAALLRPVLRDGREPRLPARCEVGARGVARSVRGGAGLPVGRGGLLGRALSPTVRERIERSAFWGIFSEDLPDERQPRAPEPGRPGRARPARRRSSSTGTRTRASGCCAGTRPGPPSRSRRQGPRRSMSPRALATPAGISSGRRRMGDDPATSVVDGDGRCHDVPNLYVFGGSTWPTSSGDEPDGDDRRARAAQHRATDRRSPRPGGPGVSASPTDDERRRLARLADTLIPARDGMPAASSVEVHEGGADRVMALRPDLRRAASAARSRAEWRLDDLRRDDPEAFRALTTLVAAAYLTEPRRAAAARVPRPSRWSPPDTPTPIRSSCASSSDRCGSAGAARGLSAGGSQPRFCQNTASVSIGCSSASVRVASR